MEETIKTNNVLGFAPCRKAVGLAITDGNSLHCFKLKPLKRYPTDTDKFTAVNKLLIDFINSFNPTAIVTYKLPPQASTGFNLELISFLKEFAQSRLLPFHTFTIKQVKELMGKDGVVKNQNQLARILSERYPELAAYLTSEISKVVKDREKYYRPLFSAIGLSLSYFKLIQKEDEKPSDATP
jgi:hypothetical protein